MPMDRETPQLAGTEQDLEPSQCVWHASATAGVQNPLATRKGTAQDIDPVVFRRVRLVLLGSKGAKTGMDFPSLGDLR